MLRNCGFNRRPHRLASARPYLAFSSALIFASSLIELMKQQYCPSMGLRSINASRSSILSFFFNRGYWDISLILSTLCQDGPLISQRTVDPSVVPHLVRIPRVASRCLNLQSTVTTYSLLMGDWPSMASCVTSALILHNFLHFRFG